MLVCSSEGSCRISSSPFGVLMPSLSLPANVDHAELTRRLTDHLAEHTEIKGIKVVRDNKGGVCAFVQCEVCTFGGYMRGDLWALVLNFFILTGCYRCWKVNRDFAEPSSSTLHGPHASL